MRIGASVTTVSWIPSDLLEGVGRLGTRLHMAHHGQPPPDDLGTDVDAVVEALRSTDRIRFANVLRAYVDFDDAGKVTGHGYEGRGSIGATTVAFGVGTITVPAVAFADRRGQAEVGDGWVRFTQTAGGRTGVPLPRPVKRPPFVQYRAPIVWSTLQLTIRADGSHEGGRRTSTMRAVTDCRVAAVPGNQIDRARLAALSSGHRREEQRRP